MDKIHSHLMQTSPWYSKWHQSKDVKALHWLLFGGIAVLFAYGTLHAVQSVDVTEDLSAAAVLGASQNSISVKDRYIVVFKPGVNNHREETDKIVGAFGGTIHYRYDTALKGFAATIPPQAIEGIKRNPNVELVEADAVAKISGTQSSLPTWGLDRIDERDLPMDGLYEYQNDGAGVRVYVIDTGVGYAHPELAGRVYSGWDFIDNDANTDDCHGHGTHVAGTVGGTTVGVAKKASIVSVRALNCIGGAPWSAVVAAIDWVAANHTKPAVITMSLNGGFISSVNLALDNTINAGVVATVAAGNQGSDACNYSPGSVAAAITVGATTNTDTRPTWSNFGNCVDISAPGQDINSARFPTGFVSSSGTSMATPHVAGIAALYLAAHPTATPEEVTNAILGNSTPDKISDPRSANKLLYNLFTGPGVLAPLPPAPPAPPSGQLGVGDLDGWSVVRKSGWAANVTIQLIHSADISTNGAIVYGDWSSAGKNQGNASCTVNAAGMCTINKATIKNGQRDIQFKVTNVSMSGAKYDPILNTDPDGDSDGTTITIRKP